MFSYSTSWFRHPGKSRQWHRIGRAGKSRLPASFSNIQKDVYIRPGLPCTFTAFTYSQYWPQRMSFAISKFTAKMVCMDGLFRANRRDALHSCRSWFHHLLSVSLVFIKGVVFLSHVDLLTYYWLILVNLVVLSYGHVHLFSGIQTS